MTICLELLTSALVTSDVERSTQTPDSDADADAGEFGVVYAVRRRVRRILMVSSSLSQIRSAFALPVLRVQPGSECECTLQSSDGLILSYHWIGRTYVCAGPDCPACASTLPRDKCLSVVTVEVAGTSRPYLLELTPSARMRLKDQYKIEGEQIKPGDRLRLSRRSPKRPILVDRVEGSGKVIKSLTTWRRTIAAVAVLHELPLPRQSETIEEHQVRCLPVLMRHLEIALRAQG